MYNKILLLSFLASGITYSMSLEDIRDLQEEKRVISAQDVAPFAGCLVAYDGPWTPEADAEKKRCQDYQCINDKLYKLGFINSYPHCTKQDPTLYTLHRIVTHDSAEGAYRLFSDILPIYLRLAKPNELKLLAEALSNRQAKCAGLANFPIDIIKVQSQILNYCNDSSIHS